MFRSKNSRTKLESLPKDKPHTLPDADVRVLDEEQLKHVVGGMRTQATDEPTALSMTYPDDLGGGLAHIDDD